MTRRDIYQVSKAFLFLLLPLLIIGILHPIVNNGFMGTPRNQPQDPNPYVPECSSINLPSIDQRVSFNISESCQNSYPLSAFSTTNITVGAPVGYNNTRANISVQVVNPTLNDSTIVDNSGSLFINRTEQAQGFFTSQDTFLTGISLAVPTTKPAPTALTLQLRNASYAGETILTIPISLTQGSSWVNATLASTFFLPQGHYYLDMPAVGAQANAWGHTINGTTGDKWVFDGTTWSRQNWNLTLKIQTY